MWRLDSPTAKSSVIRDGAGFAIDWYAEQAFTISCICRKLATASTSSTFWGLKLSLAVYINSRTWPKPAMIISNTTGMVRQLWSYATFTVTEVKHCDAKWKRQNQLNTGYECMQQYETTAWLEPTCCIADVQMDHIFLVQEEGAEVDTAGCQHSFVGLEVHPVHNKCAVTQQALLALAVELLQNLPTVPWKLHRAEGLLMADTESEHCWGAKSHMWHVWKGSAGW